MITCSICKTENHHLAITCASCGSYLQGRIDNLDLFSTCWGLIESPVKTFRRIAIAEHKNYVIPLSAVFGIALTFFFFWLIKAESYADSLLNILAAGFLIGPFVGLCTVLVAAGVTAGMAQVLRLPVKLKNAIAVIAYAMIPVILSFIILLPIELMTFGSGFFAASPSPYRLNPTSYSILLMLDGLFAFWALILLHIGFRQLLRKGWITVVFMTMMSLVLSGGLWAVVLNRMTQAAE